MNRKTRPRISIPILIFFFLRVATAFCLPEINEVVSGDAQVQYPDANTLEINALDNTIINYASFNINEGESVIINLPSLDSQILNKVLGKDFSQLLGNLSCNGLFILVNTSGIYIGANANIDAGSIILATRDIANTDFLNGNYLFKKLSDQELDLLLVNKGSITLQEGGFGVLIAGAIENEGTIIAPLGKVVLAGADAVKLDISSDGLISVAIEEALASDILDYQGKPITEQIKNTGAIQADGGAVILKAASLTSVLQKAVNLEGFVKAGRVENIDGKITIVADKDVWINASLEATDIEIGGSQESPLENIFIQSGYLLGEDISLEAGKLTLLGTAPTYLYGNLTAYNLTCTVPGKKIYFEAGKTYTFKEDVFIQGIPGYDGLIKLLSSQEGSAWYSDFSGASDIDISYVAIRDAHNISEPIKVKPSTNWGNCLNWDTDPVWDGQGNTFYWSEALNWDTDTIPTAFDVVTFNTTSHKDSIVDTNKGDGTFGGTIATLTIDGYTGTITLERDLTVSGTFTQESGTFNETIDWDDTDAFELVCGDVNKNAGTFRDYSEATAAIRIDTAAHLQDIPTKGLDENYVQYGNIDASGIANFDPIGDNVNQFTGTYNGNNYTITSLTIDRSTTDYIGLFAYVASSGKISNVGLVNVDITGDDYVGGLVGSNYCPITNSYVTGIVAGYMYVGGLVGRNYLGGNISNSYTTGSVTGDQWGYCAGGLVGRSQQADISNCYSTATVSAFEAIGGLIAYVWDGSITDSYATGDVSGDKFVGGLVGYDSECDITNSYATGTVTAATDDSDGGLVGSLESATIDNCYATGNVSGDDDIGGLVGRTSWATITNSYATGNVSGVYFIGGLVGINDDSSIINSYATGSASGIEEIGGLVGDNYGDITDCYAIGNATATDSSAGGLVGINNGTIINSYATGNVNGGPYTAGGLVGYNDYVISNCYATGSVSAGEDVGGLVAYNSGGGAISYSFSTGSVSGNSNVGGFLGRHGSGSYTDNFWNIQSSGTADGVGNLIPDPAGITGKYSSQMMHQINFAGWDFTNTWAIVEYNSYPYFQWRYPSGYPFAHFIYSNEMDQASKTAYKIIIPDNILLNIQGITEVDLSDIISIPSGQDLVSLSCLTSLEELED